MRGSSRLLGASGRGLPRPRSPRPRAPHTKGRGRAAGVLGLRSRSAASEDERGGICVPKWERGLSGDALVVPRGEAASTGWPRGLRTTGLGDCDENACTQSGEGFVGFKRERGFNSHLCPEVKRSQWPMTCKKGLSLATQIVGGRSPVRPGTGRLRARRCRELQ